MAVLDVGLVDELVITLVPITLGRGRPLFGERQRRFRLLRVTDGDGVVHLRYGVDESSQD